MSKAKELLDIFKDNDLEESSLKDFQTSKYKDYEYGKPYEASKELEKLLNKFLKDVENALSIVGSSLSPAMLDALQDDLDRGLKEINDRIYRQNYKQ